MYFYKKLRRKTYVILQRIMIRYAIVMAKKIGDYYEY